MYAEQLGQEDIFKSILFSQQKLNKAYSEINPKMPFDKVQILLRNLAHCIDPKTQVFDTIILDNTNVLTTHFYWLDKSVCKITFPTYTSDKLGIDLDEMIEVCYSNSPPHRVDSLLKDLTSGLEKRLKEN